MVILGGRAIGKWWKRRRAGKKMGKTVCGLARSTTGILMN
jgi:hypothetical protein